MFQFIGDTPRGSHQYAAGTLPPAVVNEDFDWQNKHVIAPLKHSVLYFEKTREPGDEASVFSTVYMLLSSSKPTNVQTYLCIIYHVSFRHSVLISVELPMQTEVWGSLW